MGDEENGEKVTLPKAPTSSKEQISRQCPLDLHPASLKDWRGAEGQGGVAAPSK